METTKIISPYFENGVFAGVRVCAGDEDFVIAPKDYNDGKGMTWHYMMYVLEEHKLETFNHKQACLIAAYHKEIDEILTQNGGDAFEKCIHYWTCEELMHHSGYAVVKRSKLLILKAIHNTADTTYDQLTLLSNGQSY